MSRNRKDNIGNLDKEPTSNNMSDAEFLALLKNADIKNADTLYVKIPKVSPIKKSKKAVFGHIYNNNKPKKEESKFIEFITFLDYKRIFIAFLVLVVIAVSIILLMPTREYSVFTSAYEVYYNGDKLGVIDDYRTVNNIIESIYTSYYNKYGTEIYEQDDVDYVEVRIQKQFICPTLVMNDILDERVDIQVRSYNININGTAAATLGTQSDAQWVFDELLALYSKVPSDRTRLDLSFAEDTEIVEALNPFTHIKTKEEVLELFRFGPDASIITHKVVDGETLYSIAKLYNIRVADLLRANPAPALGFKIYSNDVLNIVQPRNYLNVQVADRITREDIIEFDTITIKDEYMFSTETLVSQEGKNGLRDIVENITSINGVVTTQNVIDEKITQNSIEKIVYIGTKLIPRNVTPDNYVSSIMPMPVNNYSIKTPYVNGETIHTGIDLAVPEGTTIYSSGNGVVSFTGYNGYYGLYTIIDHGGGMESLYANCSKLLVKSGQKVSLGQVIAIVGDENIYDTSYVHFEVRVNSESVNPFS